jgi:hypothetical protein
MRATKKFLRGITRKGPSGPPENPAIHSALNLHNRVVVECHGPEGLKQRVEDVGNIMCTWGLNRLVEELVKGSTGFATDWVNRGVIGTGATPVASNGDSLNNSTPAAAVLGGGSMAVVDGGNMTLQYNMTFDSAIAFNAQEIGLFGSTADTASMVAHKTFTLVSKAAADTVNVTYQIIAGTV